MKDTKPEVIKEAYEKPEVFKEGNLKNAASPVPVTIRSEKGILRKT